MIAKYEKMLMSKTTTYAFRSVLYLAVNSSDTKRLSIKDISSALKIPFHFLGKIMQQLSRNNIISSIKGPSGGFFMADDQRKVPMVQVLELFEGNDYFIKCGLGLNECSENNPCPIHDQYKPFKEFFYESLRKQSISDWANKVITRKYSLRL